MSNRIVIPESKTASLELNLNGKDVTIIYPVDSINGYRKVADVLNLYRKIADKRGLLKDEALSDSEGIEILNDSIALMEQFRAAVSAAVDAEQYAKHLKPVEDNVPFTAWVQILTEIMRGYTAFFNESVSTEGEL